MPLPSVSQSCSEESSSLSESSKAGLRFLTAFSQGVRGISLFSCFLGVFNFFFCSSSCFYENCVLSSNFSASCFSGGFNVAFFSCNCVLLSNFSASCFSGGFNVAFFSCNCSDKDCVLLRNLSGCS